MNSQSHSTSPNASAIPLIHSARFHLRVAG